MTHDSLAGARRSDIAERVVRGGFPEAVLLTNQRARQAFFDDYVRAISQRDITELSRMTQRVDFAKVLRLAAARTASELKATDLANDAQLGGEDVSLAKPRGPRNRHSVGT